MSAPTPTDARVFWLDVSAHLRLFRARLVLVSVPIVIVMGLCQLALWRGSQDTTFPESALVSAITFVALILGLSTLYGAIFLRMLGRFRLLLGPDWVAMDSSGAIRQQVNRVDVEHVCEVPEGLVVVRKRGSNFRIPRSVNGYETVRNEVVTWAPPGDRPWLGMLGKLLIVFLTGVVMILLFILLAIVNMFVMLVVH